MNDKDDASKASEDERFAALLHELHESLISPDPRAIKIDKCDSELPQRVRSAIPVLEMLQQMKIDREKATIQTTETPAACTESSAFTELSAEREPALLRDEDRELCAWLPDLERLGRFHIVRQLGRGGYGVVVHAYDSQLERDVAIKIPRLATALSSELRERFVREAKTAASLNHPGIVTVLEVGSEQGVEFIVSEYIEGADLATRLARGDRFSPRTSAELVAKLADAMQHAHQRGVLHRDMKPSNILLSENGEVIPKITDFGLATLIDQHDLTQTGAVVGTPAYMSPEQATGRKSEIGVGTDVYGLGTVLYQMLAGTAPFGGLSIIETIRAINDDAPVPPRRIQKSCPKDLEAICLKCLEKTPAQRYESATALAGDLRRFQRGEPVVAQSPSFAHRLWRLGKRYPWAAVLSLLIVTLSFVGPIVAINQNRLYVAANKAREDSRKTLYLSDMNLALRDWDEANIERCGELLRRHIPEDGQVDYRDFAWYYLWRLWNQSAQTPSVLHDDNLESLAISPNGNILAVGGYDGSLFLWDRQEGKKICQWQAHPWRTINVEFSPDGNVLASASTDDEVKLWKVADGTLVAPFSGSRAIAFSPEGRTFAHRTAATSIAIIDDPKSAGRVIQNAHAEGVGCMVFSPDGKTLASGGWDSKVRLWDVAAGTLQKELSGDVWIWRIDWSSDGRYLATGDVNGVVHIWNAPSGEFHKKIVGHSTTIESLRFSPDAKSLAIASADSTASIWDVETGQRLRKLLGHFGEIHSAIFTPRGEQLLTGSVDGNVKNWSLSDSKVRDVLEHPNAVSSVSFSQNGELLATSCVDGRIRIWNTDSGHLRNHFSAHDGKAWRVRFLSGKNQTKIISTGSDGFIRIWEAEVGEQLQQITGYGNTNQPSMIAISNEMCIAFQSTPTTVQVWDANTNRKSPPFQIGKANDLVFSPDGQLLVAASAKIISVWDVQRGIKLSEAVGDPRFVRSVAYSPNGMTIASGSHDRTVKLWPIISASENATLGAARVLKGHAAILGDVAYSQDGTMLASAGDDEVVRIWDPNSGQQRAALTGHTGAVVDLAFSPDGRVLASAGNDGTARLWRAPRSVVTSRNNTDLD